MKRKLCVRRCGYVSVSFALELNQPKGAVLAVGFLRMGSQTLYFPHIAISKSDSSSEGFLRTVKCHAYMELVLEKCIFAELFFWKQNCRTFSFIFHFKRTKCINLVPVRTCLFLCEGSSVYTGNWRAGDFNLTFPLSLKTKPRQYKRDLLRDLCSCTALILAPWSVYLLPSRKSQSQGKLPQVGWLKRLSAAGKCTCFFISHLMFFLSCSLFPSSPASRISGCCMLFIKSFWL